MQSKDKTVSNPPHLYSTHYSTPGYVAYYLIRRIPEFIVRLQNGFLILLIEYLDV
jgi:factor associated with neutral sphingomyelinase activation